METLFTSQINFTEQIQSYPALVQERLLGIHELVASIANADVITMKLCLVEKQGKKYTSA